MDRSSPGSSVHGILQARKREWVVISFSRGFSWPRDRTHISCIGRPILYLWATREAPKNEYPVFIVKFQERSPCGSVRVRRRVSTMWCSSVSHSVVSSSLWPRGLCPARLLCPWDSPGKNTGVNCHSILQKTLPKPSPYRSCLSRGKNSEAQFWNPVSAGWREFLPAPAFPW